MKVSEVERWQRDLSWRCPACGAALQDDRRGETKSCSSGHRYDRQDGVWNLLSPARQAHYHCFICEYETVRRREGRSSDDFRYYRHLPFRDLNGHFAEEWKVRASSFRHLLRKIVQPLETRSQPLQILDLGAGNGWLSYRLALRGHQLVALDLTVNLFDGLGAFVHYDTAFLPVQAEFDGLPFASDQFDLAVFNASFHYSVNFVTTLRETLRVLKPAAQVVILDSPIYSDLESGRQMVRERERDFTTRFGCPSDALPSEHFLTWERLQELAAQLGLRWRIWRPFYGCKWALRPWKAALLGRRQPARFALLAGRSEGQSKPGSQHVRSKTG